MKFSLLLCIAFCLCSFQSFSFSDSIVSSKDLKNLAGCWKGTLTYLDYRSGKPFTMPANFTVNEIKRKDMIIIWIEYPKEPKANGFDTIFISTDGRSLNNEMVKTKRFINADSLEIITEITGKDGNDDKPAIIRHAYILGKETYTVKKEVQFVGQAVWILRNEYKLIRARPCK